MKINYFILTIVFFFKLYANGNVSLKLDKYFNDLIANKLFSGSVIVSIKNKIVFSKSYGKSNYELGIDNSLQTKFRIASISKIFTAIAIMQLDEENLLNINDPIEKYFSDLQVNERITIYNLLTHTSGLPTIFNIDQFCKFLSSSSKIVYKNKLNFVPGTQYQYSNFNYILLTCIIEIVTGISYEDYITKYIFDVCDMRNSGVENNKKIIKNFASGYKKHNNNLINVDYFDISWSSGAGAIYTTAEDLYKFDRMLNSQILLKNQNFNKMLVPSNCQDYKTFWGSGKNYGLGFLIGEKFSSRFINHAGYSKGFACNYTNFIDDNICIILLNNYEFNPIEKINYDIMQMIFEN